MNNNDDLYEKTIDAACKASQIGSIAECVAMAIERRRDLELYIPDSVYGISSLCKSLQNDLNDLAGEISDSTSVQKGTSL